MADVINAFQVNILIIYSKPEKNIVRNVIFFSYNRRSDKKIKTLNKKDNE